VHAFILLVGVVVACCVVVFVVGLLRSTRNSQQRAANSFGPRQGNRDPGLLGIP
jgi:hypothetical protein